MGETYTHGHHPSVLRSHSWRTAENSCAYLLPHLEPGRHLLDVGCGPGTITLDLASRLAPGEVLGVDLAPEIVEQAAALAVERGTKNVAFAVGDAYSLDLPARSFDVAHAHQVLQHLTDPVRALTEMRRVLRPGGLLAVRDSDYACKAHAPHDPRLDRWLELYHEVARANRTEPDAGRYLLGWVRRAGYVDAVFSTSTWTFADPDTTRWWGDLWAERVTRSAFATLAIEYGLATAGELADLATAWREWSGHPDAVYVVVHGEVLARAPR